MRTHTTAARGERDGESSGIGISRACGTFGELLQGVLPDNDLDFLVTLPIELWSTARFTVDPRSATVTVRPAHKRKSLALARALLAMCGTGTGGALTIESDIPGGKGLASSSADLVATSRAICAAYGIAVPAATLEDLLRICREAGGLGVVSAHSGTVLGVLLDDDDPRTPTGWIACAGTARRWPGTRPCTARYPPD